MAKKKAAKKTVKKTAKKVRKKSNKYKTTRKKEVAKKSGLVGAIRYAYYVLWGATLYSFLNSNGSEKQYTERREAWVLAYEG